MHFDLPTLSAVSVLISIGIAVGFSLIRMLLPFQPVLQLWSGCLWLLALGLAAVSAREVLPTGLAVIITQASLVASNALLIHGVVIHTGAVRHGRILFVGAVLYLLAICLYAFVWPDIMMRACLFGLMLFACDVWVVWLLLDCRLTDIRRSCRLAAAAFALHAMLYMFQLATLPGRGSLAAVSIWDGRLPVAGFYVILLLLVLAKCFALLLLIVERLMANLHSMARLDGLTGLLNRNAVLADGAQALQQCRQKGTPLAVLLCDLDHFKLINDTWGHQAGDAVLVHVASLIRAVLGGQSCLASRYGGEEFLLVLPDCDVLQAVRVAERLQDALAREPVPFSEQTAIVTTSVGIGVADAAGDFEQLIARSDVALYRSKREGRNRITGPERVAA
ncbi:GGDEF domain-containing protein [Frateuria aurantia]